MANYPLPDAPGIPELTGQAADAVTHRGSHLQILAGAGVGKTEVMRQRIASLADGVPAEGIVAIAFNVDAAEELRAKVQEAVAHHPDLGTEYLDQLGRCFIGTIHSYCFNILTNHVPRFETYEVADDHKVAALLARESNSLGLRRLAGGLYASIDVFKKTWTWSRQNCSRSTTSMTRSDPRSRGSTRRSGTIAC